MHGAPARWHSTERRGAMPATRSLLSREAQLLALTAGGSNNEDSVRRLLATELDWPTLAALAERERATTILWQWLQRTGAHVPADVEAAWRMRAMISEFQLLRLEQSLHETIGVLATRGIEVMLLKGSALAYTTYASFAERPMGDLDVLIRPEQAQEAWSLLQTRGWTWPSELWPAEFYTEHQHLPPLLDARGDGFRLELHTDLLPGGHPFLTSPAVLWAAANRIRVNGSTALVPSLPQQLLHLCIHFAWSHQMQWGGWRAFRDVDRLARRADFSWPEFVDLAHNSRATTGCFWTLRLARNLAGAPVPDDALRALRPPRRDFLLKRLERHYALQLFPTKSGCPSVTLGRRLWELGMAARWSGHGSVRPWRDVFSEGWLDSTTPPVATDRWPRRLQHGARHVADSLAYLWQMRATEGEA